MPAAITVHALHKRYGDTLAVDDVSFEVGVGEVFGLLGRNGAGKTTTVETIAGLRTPDRGSVEVLGLDPHRDRDRVTQILGVQLQGAWLHGALTVTELLTLYRSFYADGADPDALLGDLGLDDQRDTRFDQLSGGQQQRLSVALALVGRPRVALLDELTTGLDPDARRATWRLIERLRDDGVTVVLVTHGMDEAERLCDRIAIVDQGRVVALGSPADLITLAARRSEATVATLEDAFLLLNDRQLTSHEVDR